MSDPEIEIVLRHLQVVRIQPGDTLVLRFPGTLSLMYVQRIGEQFRTAFPDHRTVVITEGAELGVIRP